jgi:AAA+ superfamily predicted ATPase
MTLSETISKDIVALLRARNPLLWIVTREESRVERYLFEAAAATNYLVRTWDVAQGVADLGGKVDQSIGSRDPGDTMTAIASRATTGRERGVWIMRDLPAWLQGQPGAATLRQLKNLARLLPGVPRESAQAVIILSPIAEIPPELSGHATMIEWPLPDREEIAGILDAAIESLPEDLQGTAAPNGQRDAAIDAAVGLSGDEAQACYAKSLVQLRRIDPMVVAKEKKRVITRERVLEWYDPLPGGMDSVGGLENLKSWLAARRTAYSPEARAYGLPSPKGCLLAGVPGCGKSLTAKAIATAWGVPLLKLDLGALKSKFVGESEGNLRKAFRVIEAIGRCVVWIDEIEKALQGATSGSADGGVSSDALGAVLNWMQERQGGAFVIATANDAESLPPELLRKGRFDEIWWVDLPTESERADILSATIRQHGRDPAKIDVGSIVKACPEFTGSEVASLVPDAMFAAFAEKREIKANDLLLAAATVVPLAKTAKEKIERLRTWAQGRARPATRADSTKAITKKALRVLDI